MGFASGERFAYRGILFWGSTKGPLRAPIPIDEVVAVICSLVIAMHIQGVGLGTLIINSGTRGISMKVILLQQRTLQHWVVVHALHAKSTPE